MLIRRVKIEELDSVYLMGYDVWGEDLSLNEYLLECRNSSKYKLGCWYVLVVNDKPAASLIVYSGQFGLVKHCYGIGSVATDNEMRGKGFASYLVQSVTHQLLNEEKARAVFLHSDINTEFYEKLGYQCIQSTSCMVHLDQSSNSFEDSIPSYF
ncbi:GNAT family N-acetyltransferase [Vibrio sp. DW001]|uniref:GNAT family N-acetyltransferase n=1 Tax=Vibrio sp. DW001 TaxID=2912315 RepID=UPI0023AEC736|nr:GNAT family N-acetyltransferase [Vibrio sp. DW001]WED29440.1 GNAT family N-acetyltransferase [Vibrio sp. DW001]